LSFFPVTAAAAGAPALVAANVVSPARAAGSGEVVAPVASNAHGKFMETIKESEARNTVVTVKAMYLGDTKIGKIGDEQRLDDVVLVGSGTTDKESNELGPLSPVLRNREAILIPKRNPADTASPEDLANSRVKLAIGTPESAVGTLASQVVQNGAAAYGFDFVNGVRDHVEVQSDEDSDVVRALGGPATAAIAFQSDKNDAKFATIALDENFNVVSTHTMAATKNAKNLEYVQTAC